MDRDQIKKMIKKKQFRRRLREYLFFVAFSEIKKKCGKAEKDKQNPCFFTENLNPKIQGISTNFERLIFKQNMNYRLMSRLTEFSHETILRFEFTRLPLPPLWPGPRICFGLSNMSI